jgi:hypothetical protein
MTDLAANPSSCEGMGLSDSSKSAVHGVSGVDAIRQNVVGIFTGVVQSVEDFGTDAPEGRRWRVTLRPAAWPLPKSN